MPNNFLATTAWVITPPFLEIVDQVITTRLSGEVRDKKEIEAAIGRPLAAAPGAGKAGGVRPYEVLDGVAIIPMIGVMGKRFNLFADVSGSISTERVQALIEDALTDPEVEALVLRVDSPGGTVDGTAELADWLLVNRGIKPILAYIDGQCCSGALWVASACDRIHAYRTGQTGSLSAVVCHYDRSGADAKAGVVRTFITSGEYKRMAGDHQPLSGQGREYLQGFVDRYHAMFVETVAAGRGMTPEEVQARFGNGRIHLAEEALAIGMIDAIGDLPATINAARMAAREGNAMLTKEELREKHQALYQEIVAETEAAMAGQVKAAAAEALASGAGAERERLHGLYVKIHGDAAGAAFAQVADSGLTAAQLEGLAACGFGFGLNKEKVKGDDTKTRILETLEKETLEVKGGTSGPADFLAAVDAYVAEKRVTRIEAIKAVARKYPELHEAYKSRGQA